MFAQLNHIAITSDQYAINAKFYEALFGLRTSKNPRPARACVVSDGVVGMNIIPRREGRTSGLDHFGLQVEDIDEAKERINKFDPSIRTLKRPPVRPFAAYSAHDPDINIFDLYQGDKLEKGKKSIAFSVILSPKDKTLETLEIDNISGKIIDSINKMGGVLRDGS
ncbi:MAG: VOC family protein [Rhodospirillales bacterium]